MERIIGDITNFIFVSDKPEKSDIIFIPGGSHPEPALKAAELYRQGYADWVMPSGKYGVALGYFTGPKNAGLYGASYKTEHAFLKDVLVKNGVPAERVLTEDESTYTRQNAVFSRRVCDKLGIAVRRAILCCKSFHARRSLIYYQLAFLDAEFYVVPSDVAGIGPNDWFRTPYGFERVMGELARCGSQVSANIKLMLNIGGNEDNQ